jgi:hypothetical protein
MNMKIAYLFIGLMACIGVLVITSCEEKGLLVNSNDVAYLRFANDMTKDTTTVSFKTYDEGADAKIPVEVSIRGKIQEEDLYFTVSVDESRTTLPANLYVLPAECKIGKGLLTDVIYVILKNDPMLKNETKLLALQINESEEVKQGDRSYSRAMIAVTDRLFQPDWWLVNDIGSGDNMDNSVEHFYLGKYSQEKYKLFLALLIEDGVVFDGKNKQILRKYALKLKNYLKTENAGKKEDEWLKDENGNIISVPVAG